MTNGLRVEGGIPALPESYHQNRVFVGGCAANGYTMRIRLPVRGYNPDWTPKEDGAGHLSRVWAEVVLVFVTRQEVVEFIDAYLISTPAELDAMADRYYRQGD